MHELLNCKVRIQISLLMLLTRSFESFSFDGLWKNKWKIHISIVFFHDPFENQLHLLEKRVMKKLELLKLFISFVFVKKSNFVFFLFFNVIFRFIERISSSFHGYQAAKYISLEIIFCNNYLYCGVTLWRNN